MAESHEQPAETHALIGVTLDRVRRDLDCALAAASKDGPVGRVTAHIHYAKGSLYRAVDMIESELGIPITKGLE